MSVSKLLQIDYDCNMVVFNRSFPTKCLIVSTNSISKNNFSQRPDIFSLSRIKKKDMNIAYNRCEVYVYDMLKKMLRHLTISFINFNKTRIISTDFIV